MSKPQAKVIGVLLLVAAAILVFIAVERYVDNANNVAAMKSSPLAQMMMAPMGGNIEPATPTATKYCAFFAVVAAVGGVCCLVYSAKPTIGGGSSANQPPGA